MTGFRGRFLLLMGALALVVPVGNAHAVELEQPSPRQGYYLTGGLNLAGLQVWDKGERQDFAPGNGLSLRLGQMLTSRLGLGLMVMEVQGGKNDSHTVGVVGLFALEGQVRLWRTLALHAGTGLALVQLTEKEPVNPDKKTRSAYGAYTMVGLTYDFFPYRKKVSGGFAISPAVRARVVPSYPFDALAILVGVDFTWWTGLPKNQLDLPPDRAF